MLWGEDPPAVPAERHRDPLPGDGVSAARQQLPDRQDRTGESRSSQTQSRRPRPRRPHPQGEGQGAAAFHRPVHPRRGLGEPEKREPSTKLCCKCVPPNHPVSSSWSIESLCAKLRVPGPGPGKQKDLSSDAGSGAELDRQLQPTVLPSTSSIQSRGWREGEGRERAGAAPASAPGKLRGQLLGSLLPLRVSHYHCGRPPPVPASRL